MRISEVARQAGVNVETIRFYERQGLLNQPPRPPRGYRNYSPQHVKRIRFLRRCQQIGFSLAEAAEIASLVESPQSGCATACALARAKLGEIEQRIQVYERMKAELQAILQNRPAAPACGVLGALSEP